ncbi:MAG TPA: ATP-binding protein, partial [Acidimicrobiales bacterium]
RMRRNAESLLVLAGIEPPRKWAAPVRITDVIRAALGEVEDYQRVTIRDVEPATILGSAAADLAHLIAEFVENALTFSPPDENVEIRGRAESGGTYSLAIIDHGLGMPDADIAQANRRLAGTESFTIAPSKYLGHYVAGNLAARHDIHLELQRASGGGIMAKVQLPPALLTSETPTDDPITDPHGHRPVPPDVRPAEEPEPALAALGATPTAGTSVFPAPAPDAGAGDGAGSGAGAGAANGAGNGAGNGANGHGGTNGNRLISGPDRIADALASLADSVAGGRQAGGPGAGGSASRTGGPGVGGPGGAGAGDSGRGMAGWIASPTAFAPGTSPAQPAPSASPAPSSPASPASPAPPASPGSPGDRATAAGWVPTPGSGGGPGRGSGRGPGRGAGRGPATGPVRRIPDAEPTRTASGLVKRTPVGPAASANRAPAPPEDLLAALGRHARTDDRPVPGTASGATGRASGEPPQARRDADRGSTPASGSEPGPEAGAAPADRAGAPAAGAFSAGPLAAPAPEPSAAPSLEAPPVGASTPDPGRPPLVPVPPTSPAGSTPAGSPPAGPDRDAGRAGERPPLRPVAGAGDAAVARDAAAAGDSPGGPPTAHLRAVPDSGVPPAGGDGGAGTTASGLTRRVKGTNLPDTDPLTVRRRERAAEAPASPPSPDDVYGFLTNFTSGVQRGLDEAQGGGDKS